MLVSGEASDEGRRGHREMVRMVTGEESCGRAQAGPTPATSITHPALGHHWPQISELPFEASGLDWMVGRPCPVPTL